MAKIFGDEIGQSRDPLSKLSPCAIEKGFEAIVGIPKSTRRLRDGPFLVECSRKQQADNLLKIKKDRCIKLFIRNSLGGCFDVM